MEIKIIDLKVEKLKRNSFKPYGEIIKKNKNEVPSFSNKDVNLWSCVEYLNMGGGLSQIYWLELVNRGNFICDNLECHEQFTEVFVPVKGQTIIVLCNSNNNGTLNLDEIKAFFLDGTESITIRPNIYHNICFPLYKNTEFIHITRGKSSKLNGTTKINTVKKYGIQFDLIL